MLLLQLSFLQVHLRTNPCPFKSSTLISKLSFHYPFENNHRSSIEHGSIGDIAVPSNPTTVSSTPDITSWKFQASKYISSQLRTDDWNSITPREGEIPSLPVDIRWLVIKCILECCCSVYHISSSCVENTLSKIYIRKLLKEEIKEKN